jgi:DNA-binding beta-propeller fold protein YncE
MAPPVDSAITTSEANWSVEVFAPGISSTDMLAFGLDPNVLFACRELGGTSGGVTEVTISPLAVDNNFVTGLNRADGITFSSVAQFGINGALFVTEENTSVLSNQVDMIDPISGVVTPISGGNVIRNPEGLRFDPFSANAANPTLYVAEDQSSANNGRIMTIDNIGTTNDVATYVAGLNRPEGICFDPTNGDLYVCETNTNRLLRFNPPDSSAIIHVGTGGGMVQPDNVVYDPRTDTLLVTEDQNPGRILRVPTTIPATVTVFAAAMSSPQGMVFQPGTNGSVLFVSEQGLDRILRFTLTPTTSVEDPFLYR